MVAAQRSGHASVIRLRTAKLAQPANAVLFELGLPLHSGVPRRLLEELDGAARVPAFLDGHR